jgi:DNA-binding XRE family transcriptional regulator
MSFRSAAATKTEERIALSVFFFRFLTRGGKEPMARNPNFELRNRIIEKYRTQADFAPEVGMREDRLSRVINGRDKPKPEQAQRIAEKLGCRVEEIFS